MLDTLTVSRTLAETGPTPAQADAIAHAVQQAAEHGDPVTRADLTTAVAELNARSAELEVRLIKWMIGTVLAGAGLTVAVLRLLA